MSDDNEQLDQEIQDQDRAQMIEAMAPATIGQLDFDRHIADEEAMDDVDRQCARLEHQANRARTNERGGDT